MKRVSMIMGIIGFGLVMSVTCLNAAPRLLNYDAYKDAGDTQNVIYKITVKVEDLADGKRSVVRQKESKNCMVTDAFILNTEGSVDEWTRTCPEDGTDFTARHRENLLMINGTLEGKPVEKGIDMEEKPFHVYPEYSLSQFALSGTPKIKFWTLRRDSLSKLPMQAVNKGTQTVSVNGKDVEAVKVYFSITPKIREKHYNHNYYYRKSDGVLLKKEENNGKVEDLIREE